MNNQSLALVSHIGTFFTFAFLSILTILLFGCGGDDSVSNSDPTGYYTNTGDATVNADTMAPLMISDLQGMVNGTQLTMLSADNILAYAGPITVTGNSYSGTVTVYESGVATQTGVAVTGTIAQGSTMTGTLSGTGLGNGTFTLVYAASPGNNAVDNSMLVHILDWLPVNNSVNVYLSIGTDVSPIPNIASGSGIGIFDHCDFLGRFDPLDGTHLYTVNGTMSNCSATPAIMDLPYTGLASVRGTNPDDRFILVLSNGEYGITEEYYRQ